MGVPTVGGETVFDECYADNPLVNVFCLGVMPKERLVFGRASGEGNLTVLIGSTTGRDGIGGASVLASAGFGDAESESAKRPSVQVGDPFEEKRLIEACLELLDLGLAVGVQDLGAAGITGATSETAAKGGVGMDVDLRAVPLREPGMEPFEIMTSESQERMLAIVRPSDLERVMQVCVKWEVRASVIGKVTGSGRLRVLDGLEGPVLADMPAESLGDAGAPKYDRPRRRSDELDELAARDPSALPAPTDAGADLLTMLVDPAWVYRQYDHQLFLNTVEAPGADAAVLRLKAPGVPRSNRAIALSSDGNQRWCALDPRHGVAMVVAESALNVACSGARPIALVNCLNFGNPEHPEVMWQFSETIDGMAEACRVLDMPVIGGNVSFYNETRGRDIDPTPVVAVLGLIESLDRKPPSVGLVPDAPLLLLGQTEPTLAGTRWALDIHGFRGGRLPAIDLVAHTELIELVTTLVGTGDLVAAIHDVSDGGLGLTLAEMAVATMVGFRVDTIADHTELFSESPSRVVIAATSDDAAAEIRRRAEATGVPVTALGRSGGDRIVIDGLLDVSVEDAVEAWHGAIPRALEPAPSR